MRVTAVRRAAARRAVVPVAIGLIAVAALSGCTPSTPTPTTSATRATTGTAPAIAKIDLAGTATQNKAYFDVVNEKLIAAGGDLSGRPFIDNLVAAGYPKLSMEVTPDRTSVNLAADSIQFSVRFGTTCLIGQYGTTGYGSTATTVLGTGRCLAGTTRPIDW